MGDQFTPLSEAEARHLLRRAGFGALPKDVDDFVGMTRGEAADELLDYRPSRFKPRGRDFDATHNRWIKYMVKARSPLQEKLVLFWHDHFATSAIMVSDLKFMGLQNRTLRLNSKGSMKTLVRAINVDAAMLDFLNTQQNRKAIPNENYPRELLELFTLGVYDTAGFPNYTQDDIVQIARAFTGWRHDDRGNPFLDEDQHDYNAQYLDERGPKVIFQSTGGLGGRDFTVAGEGAAEIDSVIEIIFEHTDSDGKNTVARRTARRLLEYFAHPNPDIAVIDAVVAESGFDTHFSIQALVRSIFTHDAFYESMAAPGAGTKKSVKWPIDFVVSTLRLLDMKLKGRDQTLEGGYFARVIDHLNNMGQILMQPPSVFGWDWETAWVSSSTLLARYVFARDLISAREGGGRTAFKPEKLMNLGLTDPGAIVDAVTDILGVTDQLTTTERTALMDYLTDNGAVTPNLNDFDYRNEKLHGLFALILQSPAYQLH